jgi:hypothetical protein
MSTTRILATSLAWIVIAAPAAHAQEFSGYRGFQLGTGLAAVAQQARIDPEPRVLQRRPAVIEELTWQPPATRVPSPQGESVKKVVFSFHDGQLFRMVVSYDRDRTEGMTDADMVASVSEMYGLSRLPAAWLTPTPAAAGANGGPTWTSSSSTSLGFEDTILARWGDAEHSVHLFRSPYQGTFGLVIASTRLDALARAAVVEGARLDIEEAPQRELDRLQQQADDKRLNDARARQANKPAFRP